jgi:CHAT domain-containing protein/Tfp pilus assembly protein PilF
MHMKGRCRRIPWLAILLVTACGVIPVPHVPIESLMGAAQRALNRITGGSLDAEGARIVLEVGAAGAAVAVVSAAVMLRQGESLVREALQEEESRQIVAATQSFFTDECTSAPALSSLVSAGLANLGELVRFEREASEAFRSTNYEKAESRLRNVYETLKKQLGANHLVVLRMLDKRANIQLAVNNYKQGIALATEALQSREQALQSIKPTSPPGHDQIAAALAVAESANTIANLYGASSAYSDAKRSYERAIELRTRYLGPVHLCTAQSQSGLGALLQKLGDYPATGRLFKEILLNLQGKLGEGHRDTAHAIKNLASFYRSIGDLVHAQELYQRALDVRSALGDDEVEVAESRNDLGDLYKLRGDYVKAESEYNQALEIRRKKLGEGVETAQSQNALAGLYQAMGDYRRAQELYRVAFDIRQKVFGSDHPDTAESLGDLGDSHLALRDYARAESEYNQALAIRRKKLGPEHPLVARSLVALGNMHVQLANYAGAESEYNQALDIFRKKLGPEHHDVAQSQHQLGLLYQARGDYERAESAYRTALSLREKKLGAAHPSVAESLLALAKLMMATGRHPQALEYAQRAFGNSEQLLQSVGVAASESRLDALIRLLRTQEEVAYSLVLEKSSPADAATFAMSVALLRKGRSLDEAAGASRAAYGRLDGTAREELAELQASRARLGALTVDGSGDANEAHRVAEHVDQLEEKLAKLSAPLRARRLLARPSEIVTRVAQALPPDGALVEIVAFHPCVPLTRGQGAGHDPQRYLALVLHHDGSVRVVPLGLGGPIDKLVSDFRAQLAVDPGKVDNIQQVLTSAEALYHSVFEPVRAQLVKADKNIFLSLDSQLHLVPFAALFDGNRYLVETYQFTYLTSGRDLLRGEVGLPTTTKVAMIANPNFIKRGSSGPALGSVTCPRGVSIEQVTPDPGAPDAALDRLRLKSLCPLPGTVEEAQDIRDLLHDVRVFSWNNATKEAFLGLESPSILHVATHGLFRGSADHAVAGQRRQIESDRAALLGSMLMLAGAGVRSTDGTVHIQPEGVATALEVAGMNLWGTQLVVLSACESGVGDVSNLGQGVYGLRRAVMIAGAETLVTSLWKVDDRATRELMVRYYEHLRAGEGRVEAMRDTADWMRKWRKHPYYWASFIVVGSRAPLVGIDIIRKRSPESVTSPTAGSSQ